MKQRGQVKEGSLLIITELIRTWLPKIKIFPLETEEWMMKFKVSIQYILVVVEFLCDIHQVMGHVLREKGTYIWKSAPHR